MTNIRTLLKRSMPGLYATAAATKNATQLISTMRGRVVDVSLLRDVIQNSEGLSEKVCPLCGHQGHFQAFGSPPRWNARCPSCGSLERHRLFSLATRDDPIRGSVLHFAPEPAIAAFLRTQDVTYVSADLLRPDVDHNWNIEEIDCEAEQFDTIVCNHVLEHVDDRKALREFYRILKKDGRLLAMVPIVEGCRQTYEDATIVDPRAREIHFGQDDHVRVYGADFFHRLSAAGFEATDRVAFGAEAVRYGLLMGEKLFACRKRV